MRRIRDMLLYDECGSIHVEYTLLCIVVTAVIVKGIWGAYYGEPGQQVKATIQRSVFEYAYGFEGGLAAPGPHYIERLPDGADFTMNNATAPNASVNDASVADARKQNATVDTATSNEVAIADAVGSAATVAAVAANDAAVAIVSENEAAMAAVVGADANTAAVASDEVTVDTIAGADANTAAIASDEVTVDTIAGTDANTAAVTADAATVDTIAGADANTAAVTTNDATIAAVTGNGASASNAFRDSVDTRTISQTDSAVQEVHMSLPWFAPVLSLTAFIEQVLSINPNSA